MSGPPGVRVLHVTNGDSAAQGIAAAGLGGARLTGPRPVRCLDPAAGRVV